MEEELLELIKPLVASAAELVGRGNDDEIFGRIMRLSATVQAEAEANNPTKEAITGALEIAIIGAAATFLQE